MGRCRRGQKRSLTPVSEYGDLVRPWQGSPHRHKLGLLIMLFTTVREQEGIAARPAGLEEEAKHIGSRMF
jgi:hypothetical protein